MFVEFINAYGLQIMYAIITAIAGYIGIAMKNLYKKYVNTKVKRDVVETAIRGVEQIYKDIHGPEKLQNAMVAASEMLAEEGIAVTDLELRMLIEAAVKKMNEEFRKGKSDLDTPVDAAAYGVEGTAEATGGE
jgi:N-acetylmuramoyl-L-alanine amidase